MAKQNKPAPQQQQVIRAQFSYQGIIPPAGEMERYEQIHPGFADRLLKLTEEEGKHRRRIENRIVNTSIVSAFTSQICALISALGVIYLCYYAFSKGYAVPAASIASVVIVSVVLAFLRRGKQPTKDQR
jgi:uncharacterized membrane protein